MILWFAWMLRARRCTFRHSQKKRDPGRSMWPSSRGISSANSASADAVRPRRNRLRHPASRGPVVAFTPLKVSGRARGASWAAMGGAGAHLRGASRGSVDRLRRCGSALCREASFVSRIGAYGRPPTASAAGWRVGGRRGGAIAHHERPRSTSPASAQRGERDHHQQQAGITSMIRLVPRQHARGAAATVEARHPHPQQRLADRPPISSSLASVNEVARIVTASTSASAVEEPALDLRGRVVLGAARAATRSDDQQRMRVAAPATNLGSSARASSGRLALASWSGPRGERRPMNVSRSAPRAAEVWIRGRTRERLEDLSCVGGPSATPAGQAAR